MLTIYSRYITVYDRAKIYKEFPPEKYTIKSERRYLRGKSGRGGGEYVVYNITEEPETYVLNFVPMDLRGYDTQYTTYFERRDRVAQPERGSALHKIAEMAHLEYLDRLSSLQREIKAKYEAMLQSGVVVEYKPLDDEYNGILWVD